MSRWKVSVAARYPDAAEARLTDLNPWLHDRYIAQPEQEYFTAPDGWKLEGWVLKPPDFDPSRLYPTVMEIHGGPHAQYGWSFFHELQILAGDTTLLFLRGRRRPALVPPSFPTYPGRPDLP